MNEERLAYRPNEAARVIGLSRDMIYKAIGDGSLRSMKVGGARLITKESLQNYLLLHEQTEADTTGAAAVDNSPTVVA